jgi:hypothetical protein
LLSKDQPDAHGLQVWMRRWQATLLEVLQCDMHENEMIETRTGTYIIVQHFRSLPLPVLAKSLDNCAATLAGIRCEDYLVAPDDGGDDVDWAVGDYFKLKTHMPLELKDTADKTAGYGYSQTTGPHCVGRIVEVSRFHMNSLEKPFFLNSPYKCISLVWYSHLPNKTFISSGSGYTGAEWGIARDQGNICRLSPWEIRRLSPGEAKQLQFIQSLQFEEAEADDAATTVAPSSASTPASVELKSSLDSVLGLTIDQADLSVMLRSSILAPPSTHHNLMGLMEEDLSDEEIVSCGGIAFKIMRDVLEDLRCNVILHLPLPISPYANDGQVRTHKALKHTHHDLVHITRFKYAFQLIATKFKRFVYNDKYDMFVAELDNACMSLLAADKSRLSVGIVCLVHSTVAAMHRELRQCLVGNVEFTEEEIEQVSFRLASDYQEAGHTYDTVAALKRAT